MKADTVAKLLYEWNREPGPGERWRLAPGTTVIVDESGMLGTPSLDRLVGLARSQDWRLVLVGDPRQLHAVGRGGMFDELCRVGRTHELAVIHRFTHDWEQLATRGSAAGPQRRSTPTSTHHRVDAGTLEDHLEQDRRRVDRAHRRRARRRRDRRDQRPRRHPQRGDPGPSARPVARSTTGRPLASPAARPSAGATSSSPAATTGRSSRRRASRCETASGGRSTGSPLTGV